MKVVTGSEMAEIDRKAIEEYGIPSLRLMENAGRAVAEVIRRSYKKKKIIVIAGPGNNGGDGLVTARHLKKRGYSVKVYITSSEDKLSNDCRIQLERVKKLKIPIQFSTEIKGDDLKDSLVVDALFGTGLKREIKGDICQLIEKINESMRPVVSVDIPSGISSDDGSIMGKAIRAHTTVTFGLPKRGHLLYPGREFTGNLHIEDIGFPEELLKSEDLKVEVLEKGYISGLLPERKRYSHKGSYGHVLVIGGSKGKTGAVLMTARACLRSGAGLVTIGVPEGLIPSIQCSVIDEMCLPLPDRGDGTIKEDALEDVIRFTEKRITTLAIGPGLGVTEDTKRFIKRLIKSLNIPFVLDADGINCLQGDMESLKEIRVDAVLTPHPGEMARLTGMAKDIIEKRRIDLPLELSRETDVTIVLKGVPTVIASKGKAYLNPTGNPAMAKAGSGDVLTGVIAGLMAQGLPGIKAAIAGVYIHGLAGEIGAKERGPYSLLASEMIEYLSAAFKEIISNE